MNTAEDDDKVWAEVTQFLAQPTPPATALFNLGTLNHYLEPGLRLELRLGKRIQTT